MRVPQHGREATGQLEDAWLGEDDLLSRHGRVLLYISRHPGQTGAEIAEGLGQHIGSVWTVIGDLREEGMLNVMVSNRRNVYFANMDATLSDLPPSVTVGAIFEGLSRQESRADAVPRSAPDDKEAGW